MSLIRIAAGVALATLITSDAAAASRPRLDLRGHKGGIRALALHPDGRRLASVGNENAIFLWDIESGIRLRTIEMRGRTITRGTMYTKESNRIESIAFSPKGDELFEGLGSVSGGTLRVWDPDTGELIRSVTEQARGLRAVVISADGKLVAANMRDGDKADHKIAVYQIGGDGKPMIEFRGDRLAATLLAFSPDGKCLVSAGGRSLHVWDIATRKLRHTIKTHKKTILAIAFAPDGIEFVTSDSGDQVHIWNAETGKLVRDFEHEQDSVHSVAFSPSGRTIATGGADNNINLWTTKGKKRETLWGHADRVSCLTFTPDAKTLVSGSRDGLIAIWDFKEPAADEDEDDEEDEDDWDDEWDED